jgi:2-hydroxycyclohexanecarboxyl-CoA dehydrogenase
MQLKNKIVLMTGGASGIGRATVQVLAKEGASVLLCDVNEAGAKETIGMAKGGGPVDYIKLELTDGASVDACAKEAMNRAGGKIDVLINAAGWDRTQPFVEADQAFIDKVMGINLLGPVRLTRAIFPAMIQAGGGKIVFVSSDAGRVGSLGETPYSAAKGGIIGFTKSLAREGARHKITVNCVCPGPTDTPLFAANPERMREALLRAIPFRRLATPEDIAGAILYFAGPTSDYVTGQILSVSGGLTMAG